jgi:hypothetical protein
VTFSIEPHNPLISLLDKTLSNTELTVTGNYRKSLRDGNEYLRVDKFKFV